MTDAIMQAARNVVRANQNLRDLTTLSRFMALPKEREAEHAAEVDAAEDALDTALEILERAMEGQT